MGDHLVFKIALTLIPSVGAVTAKQLLSYCGSAEAVFRTPRTQLLKIPGIGLQTASAILNFKNFDRAEQEIQFLERSEVRALFYLDADYPNRLKHFQDAPVILYVRGAVNLNPERTLAVVGTRQPSPQGIAICEDIVKSLLPYNPQIISGLAYGIDGVAHKAALDASLSTLAVLGNGLHRIYPAAHTGLAGEIIRQDGALLTEFLSDIGPDRENFPMRNRIVAAMCDALLVVETGKKGGSIITAHLANDYHKDVFAVPGRIKDPKSEGCNTLIKTHKAGLVESGEDIAYFMQWDPPEEKQTGVQGSLFIDLPPNEQQLLELMRQKTDPWSIDQLSYQTQLTGSEIAAALLTLEFNGLVKSLPGKRFIPV
ncbi:MAG: DNA-protecting protein DprA [Saprospirales bacterium]|nr:DNA-protecting protein DprA [Saprospirales bacterium]